MFPHILYVSVYTNIHSQPCMNCNYFSKLYFQQVVIQFSNQMRQFIYNFFTFSLPTKSTIFFFSFHDTKFQSIIYSFLVILHFKSNRKLAINCDVRWLEYFRFVILIELQNSWILGIIYHFHLNSYKIHVCTLYIECGCKSQSSFVCVHFFGLIYYIIFPLCFSCWYMKVNKRQKTASISNVISFEHFSPLILTSNSFFNA